MTLGFHNGEANFSFVLMRYVFHEYPVLLKYLGYPIRRASVEDVLCHGGGRKVGGWSKRDKIVARTEVR
jgi:hypothetical protein